MMDKYEDIINLPHHQSKTRKHMSMQERAAQFGAFKALTGHEDAVTETARVTDARIELDEYAKAEINARLMVLSENIMSKPSASITYFIPDEKKQGGAYVTATGSVEKFRDFERTVVMADRTEIPIDEILTIESDLFNSENDIY